MENNKNYEVGHILNFYFKIFWVDQFKPKIMQSKTRNKLYYITHIQYSYFLRIILNRINFVKIKI